MLLQSTYYMRQRFGDSPAYFASSLRPHLSIAGPVEAVLGKGLALRKTFG